MSYDMIFEFKSGDRAIKDLDLDCGFEEGDGCVYGCKVKHNGKWIEATEEEIEEINNDYMLLYDLCEDEYYENG